MGCQTHDNYRISQLLIKQLQHHIINLMSPFVPCVHTQFQKSEIKYDNSVLTWSH